MQYIKAKWFGRRVFIHLYIHTFSKKRISFQIFGEIKKASNPKFILIRNFMFLDLPFEKYHKETMVVRKRDIIEICDVEDATSMIERENETKEHLRKWEEYYMTLFNNRK